MNKNKRHSIVTKQSPLAKGLSSILIAVAALYSSANATNVFITIDENGNRIFSDQPSKGAQKHKVREIQTVPAVKLPTAAAEKGNEQESSSYSSLTITNPASGSIIHRGMTGNFSVMASIVPALQEGDESILMINGRVVAQGQQLHWQLNNIERGEHSLTAAIRDRKSQEIKITSPAVSVVVQRASVN